MRVYGDLRRTAPGLLVGTNKGFTELGPDLAPLPLDERFLGIFPVALPDLRILDLIPAATATSGWAHPTGLFIWTKLGNPA
ncbi:MAG: hypothetical protein IPO56_15230 [Flavobacteriales bacterium]|nr:hypothetical protein [Flavobacteriales bacterium]